MPLSLLDDVDTALSSSFAAPPTEARADDLFRLSGSVGALGDNQRQDVIKTQLMLDRTGHFDLGSLGGPTGWPGGELTRGLRNYQKDRGLTVDGVMLPDGETLRSLNGELADMSSYRVPTPQEVDRQHAQLAQTGRQDGMQGHAGPVRGKASDHTLSDQGLENIRQYEKNRDRIYPDQAGKRTIGYGHLLLPGEDKQFANGIDAETAQALLAKDIGIAEGAIRRLVKTPLSQQEYDALVSLAYNIGTGKDGFAGSTVLKKLNEGDYPAAADAILMWDKITQGGAKIKSNGLAERRGNERDLFLNGIYKSGTQKK